MTGVTRSPEPQFQLDLNPERRREFVANCNAQLRAARERMVRNAHRLGGAESSRKYSADMDALLRSIYHWLAEEAKLPEADYSGLAIIALGGYGRAELNPHSDVDLLFLVPDSPSPMEQAFVKSFLYVLWDLQKLDLGHSTKRISEALSAVGVDLDSTTSLMETRLLAGNRNAVEELARRLSAALHGPNQRWFIASNLSAWKNRREKFGKSVYMLEPNVKESEGGLRDLHAVQWLSAAVLGSPDLKALVEKQVLTQAELDAVAAGLNFMLAARTILHDLEGRKVDVLSFDKQPKVAAALGYKSDKHFLAEEKMMRDYYLRARTIDRYAQKAIRIMTHRARSLIGEVFHAIRRRSLNDHFYIKDNVLFLKKPGGEFFGRDSARLMEAFWFAALMEAVISEEAKDEIITACGATDLQEFRSSPRARDFFMRILGHRRGAAQALHAMHETGVLGAYIPEFGKLFCLVRIDHYHKYTIDEHLLKSIEVAEALSTRDPGEQAELAQVASEIRRWDLLNLSLLLHDIGKGEGHGHVTRGAIQSQNITQRMGLPKADQETVRQLVLQHVKMTHISQRRDLEDPTVIQLMAGIVPDLDLLKMLYVLTYCDTRAVGPGVWSDWKYSLLADLYQKTALLLQGKNPLPPVDDNLLRKLSSGMRKADGELPTEEVDRFLNNAPTKYLTSVPPEKMARHIRMLRQLTPENRVVWELHDPEHLNYTEIAVAAFDVPGLLSYVCGALSSKDINILSVQVFSTKDGRAIDTFQVTLRNGRLPQGFRLDRLRTDLNNVLLGKAKVLEKFPLRAREGPSDDLAALKPPQVLTDNETSPEFTIIEVKGHDRTGLLYEITSTCAEYNCSIHLAMITTEAYRVVDVFYLTDLEFNKLEPPLIKKLEAALMKIIS